MRSASQIIARLARSVEEPRSDTSNEPGRSGIEILTRISQESALSHISRRSQFGSKWWACLRSGVLLDSNHEGGYTQLSNGVSGTVVLYIPGPFMFFLPLPSADHSVHKKQWTVDATSDFFTVSSNRRRTLGWLFSFSYARAPQKSTAHFMPAFCINRSL